MDEAARLGEAARGRTAPNPKWRWHSWDAEHVFRAESENTFTQGNWSGDGETGSRGPGAVMRRLSQNAEFRRMVADRAHHRLFNGGELSTAKLQAAFTKRLNEIDGVESAANPPAGETTAAPPDAPIPTPPMAPSPRPPGRRKKPGSSTPSFQRGETSPQHPIVPYPI